MSAAAGLSGRFVSAAGGSLAWCELVEGSILCGRGPKLYGRSVLIAIADQLTAMAALIELDGVARRLVLYPPDLPLEHLSFVAAAAEVETIVCDRFVDSMPGLDAICIDGKILPRGVERPAARQTEWILLTSGTTGQPKLVAHTLASLTAAIDHPGAAAGSAVWSTFYDIRRYGGLQIFLRAIFTRTSLVLSSVRETTAAFLARAAAHTVTHISGTPSHWRQALMSPAARLIEPEYIRLSGEIADQAILNRLRAFYPKSRISHAFASTEAGVAFDITDGLTGLPPDVIENTPGVEMKVEQGRLRVRSIRTATRYLNDGGRPLKDADGFVDTGDLLELRDNRYHFVGRRDGVINVGGLKVHPEEVEAVINRHPQVQMSLVRNRKNPLTGALVVADVVLRPGNSDDRALQQDILLLCREVLPSHKVPAVINFVATLAVAETGKLIRRYA